MKERRCVVGCVWDEGVCGRVCVGGCVWEEGVYGRVCRRVYVGGCVGGDFDVY